MKVTNIELKDQVVATNTKGHKAYGEPLEFFNDLAASEKWLIDLENQTVAIPTEDFKYDKERDEYFVTTHTCKTFNFEEVMDQYNDECKKMAFTFFKLRDYIIPCYTYQNSTIKFKGLEIDVHEFVHWLNNNSNEYIIGRKVVFDFENMSVQESYTRKSFDLFFQDNVEDMEWWLESYTEEKMVSEDDLRDEAHEAYLLRRAS